MTKSISGELLLEGPSATPSRISQCWEWGSTNFPFSTVFISRNSQKIHFAKSESKAYVDRREHYFWPNTHGSEVRCGTGCCRDKGGSHRPIFVGLSPYIVKQNVADAQVIFGVYSCSSWNELCSHYLLNIKKNKNNEYDLMFNFLG